MKTCEIRNQISDRAKEIVFECGLLCLLRVHVPGQAEELQNPLPEEQNG